MTDMEIVNRNEKMMDTIKVSDEILKSQLDICIDLRSQINKELDRIKDDAELADWKNMLEECKKTNEEKIYCLMSLYATDYTPIKTEKTFILD